MRRALVALLLLPLLLAACSSDDGGGTSALPAGPDPCGGEVHPARVDDRTEAWRDAAEAEPDELWVSLARTLWPTQLARETAGLRLTAVVVAFPAGDAVVTGVVPVEDPRPATVVAAVRERFASAAEPEVRAQLDRGEVPVGAARLEGEPRAIGRFVVAKGCLVHAIAAGDEPPPLALAVDPT